jgi:hypothetical protein
MGWMRRSPWLRRLVIVARRLVIVAAIALSIGGGVYYRAYQCRAATIREGAELARMWYRDGAGLARMPYGDMDARRLAEASAAQQRWCGRPELIPEELWRQIRF